MNSRGRYRRWHIWLGWIAAVPVLLWTISGLVMAARPIEHVRGEALLSPARPIRLTGTPIPPRLAGVPVSSLSLEQRASGPRWVIRLQGGATRMADPKTGLLLPPLTALDAAREVEARYAGSAKLQSVHRTSSASPPLELRRPLDTWRVTMSDGTRFYVESSSGQIVATRTRWWRFYDLMWGLHIMDPTSRENTSNPLMIAFAIIALATGVIGAVLLPKALRKKAGS